MRRETLYRALVFAVPLSLFGLLAWLLATGKQSLYVAILSHLGFFPYRFPFLDLDALLAAADCHRQGIDVYLSDPCDVLGRRHVYSPLWLDLMPAFLNRVNLNPIGVALDLTLIASLPVIMRPRSWGECLLCVAASLSTTVIYALERANNDIVVFLLMAGAGALFAGLRLRRLAAYLIFLLGGLIKFYPLALLLLVVRENWRRACVVVAIFVLALLGLWGAYSHELGIVLGNLPETSYYADSISARNLPFGLVQLLPVATAVPAYSLAIMIFTILIAYFMTLVVWIFRTFVRDRCVFESWSRETAHLLIGAILLTGCFFTGENISYRGIFLLLVIPGLLRLRRDPVSSSMRWLLGLTLAIILGLLWEQRLGLALNHVLGASFGPDNRNLATGFVAAVYWFCRELCWWALISVFIAFIIAFLSRMPLVVELRPLLPSRLPSQPKAARVQRRD